MICVGDGEWTHDHVQCVECVPKGVNFSVLHVLPAPDEWKSSPEFSQYLSELYAFSLDRLSELGWTSAVRSVLALNASCAVFSNFFQGGQG